MRARHRHFKYSSADASAAFDSRYIHGESDGNTIQTWSDRSGNGRDATQAIAGSRAEYKTAIQGGNAILRFNTGDFYTATFVTGTQYSLYAIYKRTNSSINNGGLNFTFIAAAGISGNASASGRRYQLIYRSSPNDFEVASNSSGLMSQTRDDNFNLHSTTAPIGSGTAKFLINGGNQKSANVSTLTGVTTGTVRLVICGTSWDTVYNLIGDLGLLVAYETSHSDSLRRRLEHASAYSFKIACS